MIIKWKNIYEAIRKFGLGKFSFGPIERNGILFKVSRFIFSILPLPATIKFKLGDKVLSNKILFKQNIEKIETELEQFLETEEINVYWNFKNELANEIVNIQNEIKLNAPKLFKADKIDLNFSFPNFQVPEVSIIIPVFNQYELTIECLYSIYRSNTNLSFEILIADDFSSDPKIQTIQKINGIQYYRNHSNIGFLNNCNAAAERSKGKFILFLNNDVQVTPGWLDSMVGVFNLKPNVGAVGPKIIYPSGHLQEAGVSFRFDATSDMVGLNDDPDKANYSYVREVDYCSGACLLIEKEVFFELGGFDPQFEPAYCEDADLCLKILKVGKKIFYDCNSVVIHHLSKSMNDESKMKLIIQNQAKLYNKWSEEIEKLTKVKSIAFYLPQFHSIPENDSWWGKGFTEWTNVKKAKPNFEHHDQPRVPDYLGYYDLNDDNIMLKQFELAKRYGIDGFCFYYYWFAGKRLLEMPLEKMISNPNFNFPFCICWANENWSRRWDGKDNEILIAQDHSCKDDKAVIMDMIKYLRNENYIRINGKPILLVYRVDLFPNFLETVSLWRQIALQEGIGDLYIVMVESHDLVHENINPHKMGCDASLEFPPLNMGESFNGEIKLVNKNFKGTLMDYKKTALKYCLRNNPGYKRFRGIMPGWDNTPRRQNDGVAFLNPSPEIFQVWLEFILDQTKKNFHGDERMIFVNAWNEWAEGAYLEPDRTSGYGYLEASLNAKEVKYFL